MHISFFSIDLTSLNNYIMLMNLNFNQNEIF